MLPQFVSVNTQGYQYLFRARARILAGQFFMFMGVGACGIGGAQNRNHKRKRWYKFGWKPMPKSIHKSSEIYFKTLQNLKESKQGPHKSGALEARTPRTE